ncbi:low molecular weight protein arginine phosphatase [Marininema halotolerans]|uniref:Protein-tyrosine phosphatase n=1 Tax=Marininema halotolerans TaxID=1155944 RepID=A0A1I6P398_9BACL|nr:low molecular weight protein arginine phosphatase [Marininema halotolerans]SFS34657.1 protein-tyrosine phosphatase [Marininema halotolerans]
MKKVLFVCTGNTCRSPMAAAMFEKMAEEAGYDVNVRSAGVSAFPGGTASEHAIKVLRGRGIDGTLHRSSPLTREWVEWADHIFTMTRDHRRMVVYTFPEAADKADTLKGYVQGSTSVSRLDQLVAEFEAKRALLTNSNLAQGSPERMQMEVEVKRLEESLQKEWRRSAAMEGDIVDPFGGNLTEYRRCAEEIEKLLLQILAGWKQEEENPPSS